MGAVKQDRAVRGDRSRGATVNASESTTSTTFADLATAGPTVAATIGPSGRAVVIVGGRLSNNGAGNFAIMAVAVTGASTRAADDALGAIYTPPAGGNLHQASHAFVLTGLAPGATTFTAKYRVAAGTGTFSARQLTIIPL